MNHELKEASAALPLSYRPTQWTDRDSNPEPAHYLWK